MLRAQRRLLRPGGRLAALVIEIAPGLDAPARRRARAAGPVSVATSSTYASLLRSAGFVDIESIDQTDEYRTTAADWLRERQRHEQAYRRAIGDALYEERTSEGAVTVGAIDDGLLRRTLYLARHA